MKAHWRVCCRPLQHPPRPFTPLQSEHIAGAISVPMFRETAGDGGWDKVKRVRGRGWAGLAVGCRGLQAGLACGSFEGSRARCQAPSLPPVLLAVLSPTFSAPHPTPWGPTHSPKPRPSKRVHHPCHLVCSL